VVLDVLVALVHRVLVLLTYPLQLLAVWICNGYNGMIMLTSLLTRTAGLGRVASFRGHPYGPSGEKNGQQLLR